MDNTATQTYEVLHEIRELPRKTQIDHVRRTLLRELNLDVTERFIELYQMAGMSHADVDWAIAQAADDRYIEVNG
uniref:Uncharacterized protein n=1 Tax=Nitrosopumivirus cobalaminus TaxID=3158414 RepID=A0AAU7N488_9VIRU